MTQRKHLPQGGGKPKLTEEQARAIREWARLGTSLKSVANKFGVTSDTVRRYARNEVQNYTEQSA